MPVQRILPGDQNYPKALSEVFGGLMPPEIWYMGNIQLLQEKAVGFCGSRNATPGGLKVAAECARLLSRHDVMVVSGYAPGVDMESHQAALASGGKTIVVLPEGIDHFRIKKTIAEVWDWARTLVLSYFPRNAVWRADRAMDRNKVIVGLSNAVIVLEARESGGTLNAGFRALEMRKPLFVAFYDDMNGGRAGNQMLLDRGAEPLLRSRSSGHAEIRHVLQAIGNSTAHLSDA
jgi:DNA processing protein